MTATKPDRNPNPTLDSEDSRLEMTTTTLATKTVGQPPAAAETETTGMWPTLGTVRFLNVIRGEWIKFWSVRSTSVALVAAGAGAIAFGMLFSAVAGTSQGPDAQLRHPVDIALGGVDLSEMIVGVLGVIFVTSEYSTGLIRTAFAAVGQRGRIVRAKSVVLTVTVFGMAGVSIAAAVIAGQAVYAGDHPTTPVSDALPAILGTSVYLVGVALIGAALGFILRSAAGGIATLIVGVFLGPNLLNLLPSSITDGFMRYLPSEAGAAMMRQAANADLLDRTTAHVVFAVWVTGLLVLAGLLVRRRDA